MFNFDIPRYEKVVGDALALRPEIEKAADEISKQGYSNIFFIGCGGTYAHSLPLKYMLDTQSEIESHSVIAAEFMLMGHKKFSKDSVCVFSTRSGNTKEIVAAAKFCKDAGARVVMYVSNAGTPACEYADYLFCSFAEDDVLCEAIYLTNIPFVARMMYNAGAFPKYEQFADQLQKITPYLIKGKELYEDRCKAMAEHHKDTDYHMVIGGGNLWGEAYDYAMCILEEMQWIKTKSIHAAEFFHGTLELVEEDTSLILFFGEDETRPLMDRVLNFAKKITKEINIFDTKEVELPLDEEFRKYISPMIVYTITERLSCHLEHVRNHPLTTRRYYRQMEY
ncbi:MULTISPECIES: SIS domain-containing protein [Oscillospiraceae]|uniref:Fructoselysine-6-phosphate deglycase n=1 Tax=Harryflintia acetispora TaxID=1849041 RepID=A0A9X8UHR5_9FIRM|nr:MULTISPECIES: SIS domain-containing protein [Oscillospiraceae]RGB65025.1 SIS domain-containing protein [Harryflintia acetispora]TCL42547.1 fructoselysine-6-phosphate deglycase [Harryflintia acetispora]